MGILIWILQNFWTLLVVALVALVALRIGYRLRKYGATRAELSYILRRSPFYLVVLVFCFFAAAPFLIMFLHSFKADGDLYRRPQPFVYRQEPTLEHVEGLFSNTDYINFIRNSVVVGIAVVVITLILSLPAAYALARLTGRWGERAGILMFLSLSGAAYPALYPHVSHRRLARSQRFSNGADRGVSLIYCALQHVAAARIF